MMTAAVIWSFGALLGDHHTAQRDGCDGSGWPERHTVGAAEIAKTHTADDAGDGEQGHFQSDAGADHCGDRFDIHRQDERNAGYTDDEPCDPWCFDSRMDCGQRRLMGAGQTMSRSEM
jgi:hypothetical protein